MSENDERLMLAFKERPGDSMEQEAAEARRYRQRRLWIRTGVLVSLIVVVGLTAWQVVYHTSPGRPVATLVSILPSDFSSTNLPRTVRVRDLTFTLERACRGFSDLKSGPTNTKPFIVRKTPWAVAYHAVRRSRDPLPMMFGAGVVGPAGNHKQPIAAFYDPGREGASTDMHGTDGVVGVERIHGNCHISVYAINCDWEVGVYECEIGGGTHRNLMAQLFRSSRHVAPPRDGGMNTRRVESA